MVGLFGYLQGSPRGGIHLIKEAQDPPKLHPFSCPKLGRALGHFRFSLIGLKRILFTNVFLKAPPSKASGLIRGPIDYRM